MTTNRKKNRSRFIWVSVLFGLLVFMGLMTAVRLLLPQLLADKIRNRLAGRPDAHLAFKHLDIELLPKPVLRLNECTAILNQTLHLSADAVAIEISISALLGGRIEPLRVMVKDVVLQGPVPLAWPRPAKGEPSAGGSWQQMLAEARKIAPRLVVIIRGGRGTFQGVSQAAQLSISDLEASADLGGLRLDFSCTANLWRRLQVRAVLEDNGLGGRLHITAEGIQPASLDPWLPAAMGVRPVDGRGNLDLTAQIRRGGVDSVALAMDWPWLTVERRGHQQRLDKLAAQGRLQHDGDQWHLVVNTFTSERPALQMSATDIRFERKGSPEPMIGADLMVRQASLDDLRALVLALAGDIPLANQATNLIIGGVAQNVHLQTTAPTPFPGIARLENWQMTGRLEGLRLQCFNLPQPLDIQRGEVTYARHRLTFRHTDLQTGDNQLHGIDLALDWREPLQLEGTVESAHIRAEDLRSLLARFPALSDYLTQARAQGGLRLKSFRIALPAQGAWQVSARGRADGVMFRSDDLPGPLTFAKGDFETTLGPAQTVFQVRNARLNLLDAGLDLTGQVRVAGRKLSHLNFAFSGSRLGVKAVGWLWDAMKWPDQARPGSAVALDQGHLHWDGQEGFRLQAGLSYSDGPKIVLDIRQEGAETEIPRLTIQDKFSNASLTGSRHDRRYALGFSGHLAARTLAEMFPAFLGPAEGDLNGRFQLSLDLDRLEASSFEGTLQAHEWNLPEFSGHRAALKAVVMKSEGPKVALSSVRLVLDGDPMEVAGQIDAGPQGLQADLHLQADALHWRKLRLLFERFAQTAAARADRVPALGGKLRLTINRFFLHGYAIAPLKATLSMVNGHLHLKVQEAKLCNMTLAGTLETLPGGQMRIDLQPSAAGSSLMAVLQCLVKERAAIHGTFDLNARLHTQGQPPDLLAALNGPIDFSATKGRIDKLPLLSKVLAFLNVTEIFAGRLPDLETQGLPYDKFTVKGTVDNGVLEIESAHLNGPSVEIGSYGSVNLVSDQLDLIVVVAPLKTVDRVIKKIPLVGTILGGNLLAVPVSVKGRWGDPRITPLAPGAVGDRLLKMFERTITLPGKLLMRPFATERPAKKENPPEGRQGRESSPAEEGGTGGPNTVK